MSWTAETSTADGERSCLEFARDAACSLSRLRGRVGVGGAQQTKVGPKKRAALFHVKRLTPSLSNSSVALLAADTPPGSPAPLASNHRAGPPAPPCAVSRPRVSTGPHWRVRPR